MPTTIHFLNVGEGDCTIIEHDSGRISLVDLSNVKRLDDTTLEEAISGDMNLAIRKMAGQDIALLREAAQKKIAPLTDALEYYDAHIGKARDIWRLIITHPHMDHMSGLHRLVNHEPKAAYNFWYSSKQNFGLDSNEKWQKSAGRYDREDWRTYKQLRDSDALRTFDQRQGALNSYWKEDGISIWAPTTELVTEAVAKNDPNILSMVLKVSYAGRHILLGGDATGDNTWPAIYPNITMSDIDVLKASHHGRNSGYHQKSVKEMSPWLTIASVGQSDHDVTRKYRQYSDYTVSMRFTGDIKLTIKADSTIVYPNVLEDHWKNKTT